MTDTIEKTGVFKSWDGFELFTRAWLPASPTDKAVIIVHRGHEHSGRVENLYRDLGLAGFSGFSYDMRGHGRSPGDRGWADSYEVWVKDLNAFINHVRDQYKIAPENMALVANSVGAVNAAAWVHDYGVPVRCMVLAAPAFRIRLYVPFAIALLRLLHKINKKAFVTSYVRSAMLTHDRAEAAAYDADPLITRRIAVNVLLGLHDTSTRIVADARAIDISTMIFSADTDYVVEKKSQLKFFEELGAASKSYETVPGAYHGVFYEKDRKIIAAKARDFIFECFKPAPASARPGPSAGRPDPEFERLKQPAGFIKKTAFGMQILGMKTVGRLSRGIKIGLETGFNSGQSLDHVYQNQAKGITFIGRLIDRGYLNAIGWRGVRARRQQLKSHIHRAAERLSEQGRPVRIMDVASGPGRSLLEVKREWHGNMSLLLRDRDQCNLDAAKKLASAWGLSDVAYCVADAFDPQTYAELEHRPNIVVVSGLYELFAENHLLQKSLSAIAGAIEPGGYIVYTGQPWHPQLEMIARTLTGSDGQPWIMRCRTQAELNRLVTDAGFRRLDSSIEPSGIFTVSTAIKDCNLN